MEACLTEPDRATAPSEVDAPKDAARWLRRAFVATVIVGLAWRCVRYLGQFPIWGDEAMLLLNILERDYAGLTQHLRLAQVAPLLFLWLEKSALLLFGASEWSVHLFPFLAGIASLLIFWRTCQTSFSPTAAGLAVGILAVSYYPVRHACEVKPYAFDLLCSTIYLWFTLARLRCPQQSRWLIGLVVLTPIAVFSSYPSVFVAGAASLVLLSPMRSATWTDRVWYGIFNVALVGSFLIHYGVVGHHQIDAAEAQRTREFLRAYWKDAFPPDDVLRWPLWLIKTFTGNMLAYPIGANHGGSVATFLFALLGAIAIWRHGQRSLFALCVLPFALNLIAAILNKYPFGDSARITLHLAPFICILTAHGLAQALERIESPLTRIRIQLAVFALLIACGVVGIARDLVAPYKTEHDRAVRLLAHDIGAQVSPGEPVLLGHRRDEEMLAEFVWYMRTQRLDLRWQSAGIETETQSYWLVQCSNQEPGAAVAPPGWRIVSSEVRFVPPENHVMPPMYCRWTRMLRE